MSTPVDVITDALEQTENDASYWDLAVAAASALTDDRIVDNAVQALRDNGYVRPDVEGLSDRDVRAIARVVLGSVGGQP